MRDLSMTAALFLTACGSDGDGERGSVRRLHDTSEPEAETRLAGDLPNGEFLIGFAIAPVGGLPIPFKGELRSIVDEDGLRWVETFSLRATDAVDATSDVLVEIGPLEVDVNDDFVADFGTFPLPAEFSPTGSEVEVDATLTVDVRTPELFCGDVDGQIVTFGMDLEGSTFGARPWEERAEGILLSCDGGGSGGIPRIKDCPEIVAGRNTAFPSGGQDREFEVVLPAAYTGDTEWPVVFAWHGMTGTIDGLLDESGLRPYADEMGAILVVPQAEDLGGTVGWDPLSGEETNLDLAFFDDMLTCVGESFAVDADRVHSTGISNGGLMTGLLTALRSDVLAATAPMSGGILTAWPSDPAPEPLPVIVIWGGETDEAYDQDFDAFAREMIETLLANGSFVVACDHGMGHELDASFWPWALSFLLDHPAGVSIEPYEEGLPEEFPEYCKIAPPG